MLLICNNKNLLFPLNIALLKGQMTVLQDPSFQTVYGAYTTCHMNGPFGTQSRNKTPCHRVHLIIPF